MDGPAPLLAVRGLTFRHARGGRAEVEEVGFTVRVGRTHGVLGGNEAGKTTLAQLLLGALISDY